MSLFHRTFLGKDFRSKGLEKAKARRAGGTLRQNSHARSLRIEPLEDRSLLSVASVAVGDSGPPFTPDQIRHAYGIDSIVSGTTVGDGEGQTIAIITAYNNPNLIDSTDNAFSTSDLYKFDDAFQQTYQLTDKPTFEKLDQNGNTDYPIVPLPENTEDYKWIAESAMDVEWAHAIAPKADIILIEADSNSFNDAMTAITTARSLEGVSVVSMSFGFVEGDNLTAAQEASMDAILTTPLGHQGVTFVAASGDTGSPGTYPAFSPNVLAVGGTSLTINSDNTYASETGWSLSGGGESQFESRPSYQPALPNTTNRLSPDVAFDADTATGVLIFDSYNEPDSTKWWKIAGGTSLSAPCWAGMIAIANQIRADQGRPTLDGVSQTLPLLYKLPTADFHDITTGDNGNPAGGGYDMVTGLGTPKANLLVPELALTAPTVTVSRADNQNLVTNATTINFKVVFSEAVADFSDTDVTIGGTAPGNLTATVSGSGTTYNVAVRTLTSNGTVVITVGAGVAHDALGNANEASTGTDNTVTFDNVKPTVTSLSKAAGQSNPTKDSPIHFTVVFSEDVFHFDTGDVTVSGSAGATIGNVSGSGTTYDVAVSNMTGDGDVTIKVPATVAQDAAGNQNEASTGAGATVSYDTTGPTVTVNKASNQDNPAKDTSEIDFTVVFSEVVTDFGTSDPSDANDVTVSGTAGDNMKWNVTGSGTTYNVKVTGMTRDGTVTVTVGAGVAHDALLNANSASTSTNNGNTVTYATSPTVTISKKDGQLDPTTDSPIIFRVVFSERVDDFAAEDVTVSGEAISTTPTDTTVEVTSVDADHTTYDVAVSGMIKSGSVVASIAADVAHDAAGNGNKPSNNATVTYKSLLSATVSRLESQDTPTGTLPIYFVVEFSEPVADFGKVSPRDDEDVTVTGSALRTPTAYTADVTQLDTEGMIYQVAVSGDFISGDVTVQLEPNVAHDADERPNDGSNSVTVSYDHTKPTVKVDQEANQKDPTNEPTINFTVVFSEPVTGLVTGELNPILTLVTDRPR